MKRILNSISTKVIVIIMIFVLPLNILAIVLSNTSMNTMVEQAKLSVSSVMQNHFADIKNRMENAQYLMYSMQKEETEGIKLCNEEEYEAYVKIKINFYYKVYNYISFVDGADYYFFYIKKFDDLMVWEGKNAKLRRSEVTKFVGSQLDTGYEIGWKIIEQDGKQNLWLFVDIDGVVYGAGIYMDTVLEKLKSDIQYPGTEFWISKEKAELSNLQVSLYSKKGEFYLNGLLARNEIVGNISKIYTVMRVIAVFALLLIPILYKGISYLLLKPLKTMNEALKTLRKGDLDYRITQKANSSEYRYSFQSFNKMAEEIKKLKIESYEKELARQKMELKNLQLQIRPHFLLNTFNLIYTLTQNHEREAVQEVILYLSDYFRYLFRSGKDLELFEKELNLIDGYLKMASVRYPGSIEFEVSYDPEIRCVRVPTLLLHNFVENIIKHVVQQGSLTHILLQGYYADKRVTFQIMDDGPGIEPEKLKELNQDMHQERKDGLHIGFTNSLRRVKYFYGEEANIEITAELGVGTCVEISFPYNLEVEDEFTDCE